MNKKTELEILKIIDSIPEPPIFGILIVENGMVKVNEEVINYFKFFNINLKEVEPIEKIRKLCEEINYSKYLMVEVI